MKPWGGIFEHYHYKASERLLVDDDGSVYYNKTPDGVLHLWCDPARLRGHLQRLWQVTHGEAVENLWGLENTGRNQ